MNYKQPEKKKRKWSFYVGKKKTATFSEFAKIVEDRIPQTETWASARGENYGAYNVLNQKGYVKKALFCVTPTKEVQEYFRKGGYDLLLSHHPYTVDKDIPQIITHTAMDCCKGGLNDMWRDALGIKEAKHFDDNLGWYGELETPITFGELKEKVENFIGGKIDGTSYSSKDIDVIRSVCICSGLGGMVGYKAKQISEADCYVFGESTRPVKDFGFPAAIETGHTKSEWMGINLYREIFKDYAITFDSAPWQADYFGKEVYHEPNPVSRVPYYKPIQSTRAIHSDQDKGNNWTESFMAQRDMITEKEETDEVFQGRTYVPGQQRVAASSMFPAFDPKSHVIPNFDGLKTESPASRYDQKWLANEHFDKVEEEEREYDCGITVVLDSGKEIYYDDYNNLELRDGWVMIKYFDVKKDAFRWHRYPQDKVMRVEEEDLG